MAILKWDEITEVDPTFLASSNYAKGNHHSIEINRIFDSEFPILLQFLCLFRLDCADGELEAGGTSDDDFSP